MYKYIHWKRSQLAQEYLLFLHVINSLFTFSCSRYDVLNYYVSCRTLFLYCLFDYIFSPDIRVLVHFRSGFLEPSLWPRTRFFAGELLWEQQYACIRLKRLLCTSIDCTRLRLSRGAIYTSQPYLINPTHDRPSIRPSRTLLETDINIYCHQVICYVQGMTVRLWDCCIQVSIAIRYSSGVPISKTTWQIQKIVLRLMWYIQVVLILSSTAENNDSVQKPDLWPRIWVTTKKEGEKKGEATSTGGNIKSDVRYTKKKLYQVYFAIY